MIPEFTDWLMFEQIGMSPGAQPAAPAGDAISTANQPQNWNFLNFQKGIDRYLQQYGQNIRQLGGRIQARGNEIVVTNRAGQTQKFQPDQHVAAAMFLMGQPTQGR